MHTFSICKKTKTISNGCYVGQNIVILMNDLTKMRNYYLPHAIIIYTSYSTFPDSSKFKLNQQKVLMHQKISDHEL